MEEIHNRVINVLQPYTQEKKILELRNSETRILLDLKVNSARFVDLVLDAEDEFEIEISDSEINDIHTIGDLVRLVTEKTNT
jgi:acyl carrier protein